MVRSFQVPVIYLDIDLRLIVMIDTIDAEVAFVIAGIEVTRLITNWLLFYDIL